MIPPGPRNRMAALLGGYLVLALLSAWAPGRRAPSRPATPADALGLRTWREGGCPVCHALYGLGGHLGPDLTDVVSRRGPELVRARVLGGAPGMPAFPDMPPDRLDALVGWLARVDGTGDWPLRGWPRWGYGEADR